MLTFAYIPCVSQFPFGGDVSVILPMRSSAGTLLGAAKLGGESAVLSVEESRLARRPPRKRRAAAFTPRSETTIGTGLNSSKRDDIQTMDRQVFGLLFF